MIELVSRKSIGIIYTDLISLDYPCYYKLLKIGTIANESSIHTEFT